jgi:hypothetical protein
MAEKRKKRKRKSKGSSASTSGGDVHSGGGGGLLQGIRNGIRRAAGTDAPAEKPSKTSNIITGVLLLAAIAFLLYRWYG